MKLGYSNLLGEHLDAEGISYGDCGRFQIVCPICHEPVFKAEREQLGARVHYLSHYPTSKSYVTECEQRVAGMLATNVAQGNIQSRRQTLQGFLARLPELLTANRGPNHDRRRSHRALRKSKTLLYLCNLAFQQASRDREMKSADWFHLAAEDYIGDLANIGSPLQTSFAISVQKRIAHDIWLTALTGNGRVHHDFLFFNSYLMLLNRIGKTSETRALSFEEREMGESFAKIALTSKAKGMAVLEKLMTIPAGPPFGIMRGPDLFNRGMDSILYETIGALIKLPYLEVLQELRAIKDPVAPVAIAGRTGR